jgi:organic radical activating enzyme
MKETTGYIAEIFRSIQGEGEYLGVMQVFLRMAGCSRQCVYCDTRKDAGENRVCRFHEGDNIKELTNPLLPDTVFSLVSRLLESPGKIHSLSITGGEPLEQPVFLIEFLKTFRKTGIPVFLETNGLELSAVKMVKHFVDIIALDIKLPSLCGGEDLFPIYREVLREISKKRFFCKVVVSSAADLNEFEESVSIVSEFNNSIPFVIQPATLLTDNEMNVFSLDMGPDLIMEYYMKASKYLDNVKVIPQCHHLLGVL